MKILKIMIQAKMKVPYGKWNSDRDKNGLPEVKIDADSTVILTKMFLR